MARKSPPLKEELIEYLKQLAREHKKDTSIVHRVLQDLLSDISSQDSKETPLADAAFEEGKTSKDNINLLPSDVKILNAIKSLQEQGKAVTRKAIAKEAGLNEVTITRRKNANPLIEKAIKDASPLPSDVKILNAIKSLQEQGKAITQGTIAEEAVLSEPTIINRKKANPLIAKAIEEALLLPSDVKILNAIKSLKAQNKPVTRRTIAEEAILSELTITNRKNANPLIKEAILKAKDNPPTTPKPRGVGAAHYDDAAFEEGGEWETTQEIEKNVEKIIPLLVQALIARARKEKVVLALDTELGPTEKVRELISKYVIDTLGEIHGNNGDIKVILKNLNIIDGKGKDLVQRIKAMTTRGNLKKENVIMLTTESNLDNCSDFKEQAFITALDDSRLSGEKEFDYYPLVELTFFAVLRALAYDKGRIKKYQEQLWKWYKQIPNVEKLNFVDLMKLCFDEDDSPKRTIILKLIPNAKKFEYDELEELYRRIQEFIRKA